MKWIYKNVRFVALTFFFTRNVCDAPYCVHCMFFLTNIFHYALHTSSGYFICFRTNILYVWQRVVIYRLSIAFSRTEIRSIIWNYMSRFSCHVQTYLGTKLIDVQGIWLVILFLVRFIYHFFFHKDFSFAIKRDSRTKNNENK